jgi:hypothetical protein
MTASAEFASDRANANLVAAAEVLDTVLNRSVAFWAVSGAKQGTNWDVRWTSTFFAVP